MKSKTVNTPMPTIELDDVIQNIDVMNPAIPKVLTAFRLAAKKLEDCNAWPKSTSCAYQIRIGSGNAIETHWRAKKVKPESLVMEFDTAEPFRIQIGIDIFDHVELTPKPTGAFLIGQGLSFEDAAFVMLAHEIFHLTELDRMIECNVNYGKHHSGFAHGVYANFEPRWQSAAFEVIEKFKLNRSNDAKLPPQKEYPLEIWRPSDIASEACADLLALQIVHKNCKNWKDIRDAVIQLRLEEEASATSIAPTFLNGQPVPPQYQIGKAIQGLIQLIEQDDPCVIISEAWAMSLNELAKCTSINSSEHPAVFDAIKAQQPLTFVQKPKNKFGFKK